VRKLKLALDIYKVIVGLLSKVLESSYNASSKAAGDYLRSLKRYRLLIYKASFEQKTI